MTDDYLDRFLEPPPGSADQDGERGAMGIPLARCMVVGRRATCTEEIEALEREYLEGVNLPLPFWDADNGGALEPLMTADFEMLERAGVSPTEWEIMTLEDHLAGKENQ